MSDHQAQPPSGAESQEQPDDTGSDSDESPTRRRGFVRRHKALTGLLALFVILGVLFGGSIYYVNGKLGQIDRVEITLPETGRPDETNNESINILLAGVDNGEGSSIAEAVNEPDWTVGQHRSDTIIILHISADRRSAYLVSIPRDSYVPIYNAQGQRAGVHKVNAAFSYYGPSGYVSTIEHLTGLRMDHLAMIDWTGFEDLTDALGGVRLFVPATVYNRANRVTWTRGSQDMDGEEALRYVRTRYGLAGGDFDRIERQQNFLRAIMKDLASKAVLANPLKLNKTLNAVTQNLTIDNDWSNRQLQSLAFSMRRIKPEDVTFLTAPLAPNWNQYIDGEGAVVYLDKGQSSQLWQALADDTVTEYATAHRSDQLPGSKLVN